MEQSCNLEVISSDDDGLYTLPWPFPCGFPNIGISAIFRDFRELFVNFSMGAHFRIHIQATIGLADTVLAETTGLADKLSKKGPF